MSSSFCYRVYWEHTDAGGVVYHARYLNFLERARSDWLSAIGVDQLRLREQHGLIFVVTRVEVDFRRPARLEDELRVDVCVQHCGHSRVDFEQTIVRDGECLLTACVRAACIDADQFVPARMPQAVRTAILEAAASGR
ncbi:MAG: tol-pal system-associated acyl-CoA thioesterase [Gammaproteobacteria bacterium HGW-Gammaproteobacteria-8]|nr:MAG: tol-pal system-associated acyl-CoA thioesterase [Gammaproteobacteria bacterium HGW-Gammaproteobacteria-8]